MNDQQRQIIREAAGKVAVVAGAGSGKTTTNIELIVKLHQEDGVPLERMFITTFTNKSGRDLKEKLQRKLRVPKESLDNLWVGTFHSLGFRYLTRIKKHKLEIILPLEAKQYLKNIYKQVVKEHKIDEEELSFATCMDNIDRKRSRELSWEESSEYPEVCAEIFNTYQKEKSSMGLVDYEDILQMFERELIEDKNDVLPLFTERFDWVFVDENQDSVLLQNRLADLLTTKNQVVIGDPKQSIYGFRGAAPHIFKERIDLAEKMFNLSYNYRSSKNIIDFANSLLVQMPQFKDQYLIPTKPVFEKPMFILCNDQAQQIFNNIQLDIRAGLPLEEIAVLGRSVKPLVFQKLQILLRSKNIPYVVRGGDDKLNSSYMQHFLSILKSVLKPTKVSLTNTLGLLPSVGPKTAMKLADEVMANGGNFDVLVNQTGKFATTKHYSQYLHLETLTHDRKELLLRAMDFIYDSYLLPVYGKKDVNEAANKRKLIFDALYKYLMEAPTLLEGIDSLYINEEDLEAEKGKIIISTGHQSKGLEFESVHLANFNEGGFPSLKEDDEGDSTRIEEEFCLTYVAVTRAKKKLKMYMSYYGDIPGSKPNKMSRFLKDVYARTGEQLFTFRALDIQSESNYKDALYNKVREEFRRNSGN